MEIWEIIKTVDYSSSEKKVRPSNSIQSVTETAKDVINNATLREAKRITREFKEQKLMQRIKDRGGLYPKEFSQIENRSESSVLKQNDKDKYDDLSRFCLCRNPPKWQKIP